MTVLRHFFIGVLATAAAPLTFGQEAAPRPNADPSAFVGPGGAGATDGTQNVASVPDFSGIWAHPYFPGFEPPASGPGPIVNRSRRPRDGVGNANQFVGDYTNPILKPQAAEVIKRHGEISLKGETYPTPSNQCWPSGVPYIFFQHGLQMLQLPDKVVFLYLRNHEFREVRLNEPHPAHVAPSWYGDSVGHYEGDTLVIDTVGVKKGPFAMVDMYGTPFSPALHVVERYRLIDYAAARGAIARNSKENIRFGPGVQSLEFDPNYRGKHLQLEFTVDDEGVFTMPWTATITYAVPLGFWEEHVCAENPRGYFSTGPEAAVPTANAPDF
jgi:hypothetical protein